MSPGHHDHNTSLAHGVKITLVAYCKKMFRLTITCDHMALKTNDPTYTWPIATKVSRDTLHTYFLLSLKSWINWNSVISIAKQQTVHVNQPSEIFMFVKLFGCVI